MKENDDPDERSIVFVERTILSEDTAPDPDLANADKVRKRRSRSICEKEVKRDMMAATSPQTVATPEHKPSGSRTGDINFTGIFDNSKVNFLN